MRTLAFQSLLASFLWAVAFGLPTLTWASPRTVCFELGFRDARTRCPGATGVATGGARRMCNPGGFSYAINQAFELWSKNASGNDDFLGEWATTGAGETCVDFDWALPGNPSLYIRALPDIYAYPLRIVAQRNFGTAASPDWRPYRTISWRDGVPTDPDRFVAEDCAEGVKCRILPGRRLIPSTSSLVPISGAWMVLDSAGPTVELFADTIEWPGELKIRLDNLNAFTQGLDPDEICRSGCARWLDRIHIPFNFNRFLEGELPAHEIGHFLQLLQFDEVGWGYRCVGRGWVPRSRENEACATIEGFASYVAAVSWYDPDDPNADPEYSGASLEAVAPVDPLTCSNNRVIPLQAMRGFWDLDDVRNEPGAGITSGSDDVSNFPTPDIMMSWGWFGNGTNNRETKEADADGPNLWDYVWNRWGDSTGFGPVDNYETLLRHNCLGSQDLN